MGWLAKCIETFGEPRLVIPRMMEADSRYAKNVFPEGYRMRNEYDSTVYRKGWTWFAKVEDRICNHTVRIDTYANTTISRKYLIVLSTHNSSKINIEATTSDEPTNELMLDLLRISKFLEM